jgi:hypothetical protein
MSWEIGFTLGPAIGGIILALEPLALWPIAGIVLAASVGVVLRTEDRLPPALRKTPSA